MMQFLRRNMKWIFVFVIICFVGTIFFAWGMGKTAFEDASSNRAFAVINGQEITEYDFDKEWNNVKESQGLDDSIPEFQLLMYKKQILNNMITRRLVEDYIVKSGIKLTKEDEASMKGYIRYIAQMKYKTDYRSLNDGAFNVIKQEAVQALLQEKLGKSFSEQVKVSEKEIEEEYLRSNEKRKFKYARFEAKNYIARAVVKPEDISKYYNDKKESFKAPIKHRVQYLAENLTAEKAENLYKDAAEKKNLSAAAKAAGVKANEAEFSLQELVPGADFDTSEEIKKTITGLAAGETAKPVKIKKGYLLVMSNGTAPDAYIPLESVKPIIESMLKSEKAMPYAEMEAEKVFKQIKEEKKSFEEAVKGLAVFETDLLKFEDTVKGVEDSSQFNMAGFALANQGDVSKLVKSTGSYYILKLVDVKRPAPAQFAKEKDKIKETLVSKKQRTIQYEFIAALKKDAKIVDNSDKVFSQMPAME